MKIKVTKELIQKAYDLAKAGFADKQIYETLGIAKATFYAKIDLIDNIKRARTELRESISKSLLNNALDLNNPTIQIFLAKKLRLFDDTFDTIKIKNSDDLLTATNDLFTAVATSSISDDKANQLKSIIESYSKLYEINNLEKRLTVLEARNEI